MWKEISEHEIKQYPIGTRVKILSSGVNQKETIYTISSHCGNDSSFTIEDEFWKGIIFSSSAWQTHKVFVEVDDLEDDIKQLEKKYKIKISYESLPRLVAPGTILRRDDVEYMLVQTESYGGKIIQLDEGNRLYDVIIPLITSSYADLSEGDVTYGARSNDKALEGFEILWHTTPLCYIHGKEG